MKLIPILLMLICYSGLYSQKDTIEIHGLLRAPHNNEPMPLCKVILDSTNIFAITDMDGKYKLKVARKDLPVGTHYLKYDFRPLDPGVPSRKVWFDVKKRTKNIAIKE